MGRRIMSEEDALLREVDEELRREQLEKLWKRYGNWFIAFSFGIVAAVAGYKGWQYYQTRQAQAAGEAYASALDLLVTGKGEEGRLKLASLAEGSHKGAATLARMKLAALDAKAGKTEDAIALYEKVEKDETLDLPLRNAARIRHAWLIVDSADRESLKKLLGGLDVPGSPWRAAAWEILALSSWRAGDLITARNLAEKILLDPETPPGARQRARILMETVVPHLSAEQAGQDERASMTKTGPASAEAENAHPSAGSEKKKTAK